MILVVLVVGLACTINVSAVKLEADGCVMNISGANITPKADMWFDNIAIRTDDVVFNNMTTSGWNSTFNITPAVGKATIHLYHYQPDNFSKHEAVNFTVNHSSGDVVFNVTGINGSRNHYIHRNGTSISTQAAGPTKYSWTQSSWTWWSFVLFGNSAPVISAVADLSTNIGEDVGVDLTATDSEGDTLTFSRNNTGLWATWNATTGVGNWTVDVSELPLSTLWGVSDGFGGSDSTTNTVTWSMMWDFAGASDQAPSLSEGAYDELHDSIEANGSGFGFVNFTKSMVTSYTNVMGNMFFLIIFALPYLMMWLRQQNIIIPAVTGIIMGTLMIQYLPSSYQFIAVSFIGLSITAILYTLYHRRG